MTDWRSRRFGRSASTYHQATPIQARMAALLVQMLDPKHPPGNVLELGSGTGHLTEALHGRFPDSRILATDLSPSMLHQAQLRLGSRSGLRWEILDGKAPTHPDAPFDLIASNAMVQWFPALGSHLKACRELLAPQGTVAIGGFCHDHFPELDAILRSEEFGYPPGPGHNPTELPAHLAKAGFTRWDIQTSVWEQAYDSARAFLEHLRESGANRPPPSGHALSKERLRLLLSRIEERCGTDPGIRITWKPWFLVAS